MALSRSQRRELPADDFAVPGKRALPINDARHVRMAWSQVAHTHGLTDEERAEARKRILAKAKSLDIDTSGWEMHASAGKGLYIRRNLTPASAAEFREWALGQGFLNVMPADELHVTIIHSEADAALTPATGEVVVAPSDGDDREVVPIGDGGAVALRFESPELHARWEAAIAAGAVSKFDEYLPHVTIAWSGEPVDVDDVSPYTGALVFGPEVHEPINSNWVPEKAMRMEASGIRLDGEGMEAMALSMPEVAGHPNRMPFSGILTRLDTPSDRAPGGSGGKRVIMTKSAAERALPSLIGMAVDFTPNFDGHDAVRKFGVITAAHIEGDAIRVGGHIYARDFPKEASRVQTDKALLGMSWELAEIFVERLDADPLVITDAYFTGAAILRKDKAAYQSTSLAASAEEHDMTKEEIMAAVGEAMGAAVQPLTTSVAALQANLEEQGKKLAELSAAADEAKANAARAAQEAKDKELDALKTKVADLEAAAANRSDAPERKTLSPAITAMLAKADLTVPEGDGKLAVSTVDAALSKAGISTVQRMQVKNELQRAGRL